MKGKIYKIDTLKTSRNKGEVFKRVYFEMYGALDGHKFWAKTDIVPSFKNYGRWRDLLKVGNTLDGLSMRKPDEVNADSRPRLIEALTEIKKQSPAEIAEIERREEVKQLSLL